MDFALVQQNLNDLPSTFLRDGTPFTQYMEALSAALTRDTSAVDQVLAQVANYKNAQFGWVDLWGLLFNTPRQSDEADENYLSRIQFETTFGNGTPVGMAYWVLAVWRIAVTIQESLPNVGYSITFPSTVTDAQIAQIVESLARVRPAGVPITGLNRPSGEGLYLTTINFLGAAKVTGAFLSETSTGVGLSLYPATNNAVPILPDYLLTDPTLNP